MDAAADLFAGHPAARPSMIWDADFMLGPPGPDGTDSYVLGEINVSSVFPIPVEASAEIACRVADRLRSNPQWSERRRG